MTVVSMTPERSSLISTCIQFALWPFKSSAALVAALISAAMLRFVFALLTATSSFNDPLEMVCQGFAC
jgi:hypothetical protein